MGLGLQGAMRNTHKSCSSRSSNIAYLLMAYFSTDKFPTQSLKHARNPYKALYSQTPQLAGRS